MYGIDENMLACLDLANGKRCGRAATASTVTARCCCATTCWSCWARPASWRWCRPRPSGTVELGRIQAIEGKTWNNPTLVGRRIFVRNHLEMAAYDLPLEE